MRLRPAGCVAGASVKYDYLGQVRAGGFGQLEVVGTTTLEAIAESMAEKWGADDPALAGLDPHDVGLRVASINVKAVKRVDPEAA